MQQIAVTELRKQWSEVLRRVEGGDSVLVTRRGSAIGQLVPTSERAALREGSGVASSNTDTR